MLHKLEQGLGALVLLFVLFDVFMTVLYARVGQSSLSRFGTGIMSIRVARLTWRVLRRLSEPMGRHADAVRSFAGPLSMVFTLLAWSLGMTLGTALIIHPTLGDAYRISDGPTPTDFLSALYAAGTSLAITGSSDFAPHTTAARLFALFTSIIGASFVTLTVTYLFQLYSALLRRNSLALQLHLLSAETGDAAELVAGLGAEGQFRGTYSQLSQLATEMTTLKESYHFYPLLFFFRSRDTYESVARFTLLALDTVTLIKGALSDEDAAWLKESATVAQLWRAAQGLLTLLEQSFLPGAETPSETHQHGPDETERWRRRFHAGVRRIRQAAASVCGDENAGADVYVALRAHWDEPVMALCRYMAHSRDEIDPAGHDPEASDRRLPFRTRRHGVA